VAFDGPDGGSASLPALLVNIDLEDVVGNEVERTIRKIYTQQGLTRHGFKVRPAV
jgi:hydroxymethylglutaryl-CoA synthase